MANFNPNRPAVLGTEWLLTHSAREPVREQGWVQRLPSLAAETVTGMQMAGEVTRSESAELRTLVDVIPEGSEQPGAPQRFDFAPNSTDGIGTWTTLTGSTSNLHLAVDDPILFPNTTVQSTGIRERSGFSNIAFGFNTGQFAAGGDFESARICGVSIAAVAGVLDNGFRSVRFELRYDPTGQLFNRPRNTPNPVQLHAYGLVVEQTFGELNPLTGLPWVPSDIAAFNAGDWQVQLRSQTSTTTRYPVIYALALRVHLLPVENRSAVAVWRRSGTFPSNLITVTADDIISVPSGASGWAKPDATDHLYWWRQARSPYFHGNTVTANDVRWIRQFQQLGSDGNPPGAVPPPSRLRASRWTVSQFGIPQGGPSGDGTFTEGFVSASSIALLVSSAQIAADTFTRVETGTWGTSSSGHMYVEELTDPTELAVNGTQGVITLRAVPTLIRRETLDGLDLTDCEVLVSITPNQVATGAAFLPGIVLRRTDGDVGEYYRCRLHLGTDNSVSIAITRGSSQLAIETTAVTYAANGTLWLRARVDGHRVRGRVWADGNPEPSTWNIDHTVTSGLVASGRPGVSGSAFGGNTNVNPAFAYDNLQVFVPGVSNDSQPYRYTPEADLTALSSSQSVGQRVTPLTTASYIGVKTVVSPPSSGGGQLQVSVHRVSDGVQVGGQLLLTASEVRSLTPVPGQTSGLRYIEGFLSSAATLTAGTACEIRLSTTGSGWRAVTPSSALGPEASFDGPNGIILAGVDHDPNRDLIINLQVQPDPPQDFTVEAVDVPVNNWTCSAETIQHLLLDWEPGASPLGPAFARYEIQRQLIPDLVGTPCEPVQPSMLALDGLSGSNASTPDRPSFAAGATPIQAVIEVNPDQWAPAGGQLLIGQWPNVGGQNSWVLALNASGELNWAFGDAAGNFDNNNQRTSTVPVPAPNGNWRFVRVTVTPDDGSADVTDSVDGSGDASEAISTSFVAPSVTADDANDLLICAVQSFEESPETITAPGSMTPGTTTNGLFSDLAEATEVVAAGPTGTRTFTYGQADAWSAVSVAVFGGGTTPTVEEVLSGYTRDGDVQLTTDPSTQAGDVLIGIQGLDWDPQNVMAPPSGSGWHAIADSGIASTSTSRIRVWAKRLTVSGAQQVTFPNAQPPLDPTADNHVRLFRLSGVLSLANDITRFELSTDGQVWSQVGSDIVAASGGYTLFDSPGPLIVGGAGGQELTGAVRSARVRINDVVVASPDFTVQEPGATSFADAQGNTWTINATGEIAADPLAAPILSEDPDCVWVHVADIASSEGLSSFLDREAPRGVEAIYRIRVVATTGAFSEWVTAPPVAPQSVGCVLVLTSNAGPDLEAVFDHEPEVGYELLNNQSTELVRIAGADYQVVFTEPEDRGKTLSTVVVVNFKDPPVNANGDPVGGIAVFDPLFRIAESRAIPYVVVLDRHGNRWLGYVEVTQAVENQPGHRYHARVTIAPTHANSLPVEE